MGPERRAHPRIDTKLLCTINGTTGGRITNLSLGGALVRAPLGFAHADQRLGLEFTAGSHGVLALEANVVRVAERSFHGECGVRFVDLNGHREVLGRFIDSLMRAEQAQPETSPERRRVTGALFVDYVRMLRACKGRDWSRYLRSEDLAYLGQRIQPGDWYPMETFERMGLAILAEVAGNDLTAVRAWGREQIDWLAQNQPGLVAAGDPCDSLMRFQVMRNSFFDYGAVEIAYVSEGEAAVQIGYRMSPLAEEAASLQSIGFLERLLELSGAHDVEAWFSSAAWKGDPSTTIELRWKLQLRG